MSDSAHRDSRSGSARVLGLVVLLILLVAGAVVLITSGWSLFPRGSSDSAEGDVPPDERPAERVHAGGKGELPPPWEEAPEGKGHDVDIAPGKGGDVVILPGKGGDGAQPPELECSVPGRTQDRRLRVAGRVRGSGLTVAVNGELVSVRGGRFQTIVDLVPGENAIDVFATDVAGSTAVRTLVTTLAMSPETTFRSLMSSVADGDWAYLYASALPSERETAEEKWETDKRERPARVRRVARVHELPLGLVQASSYRDLFLLRIHLKVGFDGGNREAFRKARVVTTEVDGNRCVLRCEIAGEKQRMELERQGGVWYLSELPEWE